jgi:hypothetical protein
MTGAAVTGAGVGRAGVTGRAAWAAAVKAGDVTLRFVDGEVGSVVHGSTPPRSPSPKPKISTVNQGNLFDG